MKDIWRDVCCCGTKENSGRQRKDILVICLEKNRERKFDLWKKTLLVKKNWKQEGNIQLQGLLRVWKGHEENLDLFLEEE